MFNFGKKKQEKNNLQITSREESMKLFEEYAKELMKSDDKGGFFMLILNNGFSGKACMGTPEHFEDMFCQLFQENPELKDMLKEIISRYESGKAKFRKDGQRQPIGKDITEIAETFVGKGNINNPSRAIESTEDKGKDMAELLKAMLMGNSEQSSGTTQSKDDPKAKMFEEYDKYKKKLKEKGISDYNIDDIKKRNKQ